MSKGRLLSADALCQGVSAMKRIVSLLLSAALLPVFLSACQWTDQLQPPERQPAASDAVSAMLLVSGFTGQSGNLEYLTAETDEGEFLTAYLENAYGLSDGTWKDAAIIRATGASAFELTVLRLENEDGAARAAGLLTSYLAGRRGDFVGYAPEQAELVANAGVAQEGTYAALCICPDPDQAVEAFRGSVKGSYLTGPPDILPATAPPSAAFPSDRLPQSGSSTPEPRETQYTASYPGRCDFTQPNIDDMSIYDTSAILNAWELGSPLLLSDYDKAIYNAAKEVLDAVLRDGMSDLEKETAVYHWIVNHVNYDWTHQDVMVNTPRESFTPYGGLVNHTAVCLGYAATFQLLMDLAGVECITVVGAAESSTEDHGWNMVRLNGNWYCVDVTWDANFREYYGPFWGWESSWRYFNVTSDTMAKEHQWDYANVPEAVTWGNGRG